MSGSGPHVGERGETLLELLVAIVILGVTALAVVGGLVNSIVVADIHRKQATAGVSVRDYAEAVVNYVNGSGYVPCAPAGAYAPVPVGFTVPAGFTATETAALSWNGSAWVTCASDAGYQKITVRVASDDSRAVEALDVVLREPCRPADGAC